MRRSRRRKASARTRSSRHPYPPIDLVLRMDPQGLDAVDVLWHGSPLQVERLDQLSHPAGKAIGELQFQDHAADLRPSTLRG